MKGGVSVGLLASEFRQSVYGNRSTVRERPQSLRTPPIFCVWVPQNLVWLLEDLQKN